MVRAPETSEPAFVREGLVAVLRRDLPAAVWAWVDGEARSVARGKDREAFATTFATVSRRVGRGIAAIDASERTQLGLVGDRRWRYDELVRAVLLLDAATTEARFLSAAVADCYRHGETREREAILGALILLPGAEEFLPLALDACRTHVQPLFESLACENWYPARYFPDSSFAHLVLKAVFLEIPLRRIVGLGLRRSPEITRMARDYASERRAAARPVPPDLARLENPPAADAD